MNKNYLPFTELYRPKIINDLILDQKLKITLNNIIQLKKIPNLILYGPPGTGKTSTAICIAKNIVNQKFHQECILEINASDNRCLDDVESKIIIFCKKKSNDIKFIILDEADIITKKAMKIIDDLIDNNNNNNFIFTCNSKKSIIESIQSKCCILLFDRIPNILMENKLEEIYQKNIIINNNKEKINIKNIILLSHGDFRKALNTLELYLINDNMINFNIQKEIEELINYCLIKDIKNSLKKIDYFIENKYDSIDIIFLLIEYLKIYQNFDEDIKIKYISILYKAYSLICHGVNTKLQLYSTILKLQIDEKNKK